VHRRWVLAVVGLFVLLTVSAGALQSAKPKAQKRAPAKSKGSQPAPLRNAPDQAWTERVLTVPIVGHATAYVPKAPVSTVILFFSGDGGWNLGVVDMARRIMPKAIVIGLSYPALRKAHASSPSCWMPSGDVETISHAAQRELKLPEYHPPIVLGYSSGATLVYELLAASPASTFSGGLSMGFCPDLPSDHPVCAADDFKPTFEAGRSTAWIPKVATTKHDWYVLNGEQDQVCLPPEMHRFLDGIAGAHFIEIPGTGHGFAKPVHWGGPFDESIDALIKTASAPRAPAGPVRPPSALEPRLEALGLPLEYRWADRPRATVIFISGDGGWATLDDKLAVYLSAHGVSVVGVSALRYFWSEKSQQQAGADMRRVADLLAGDNLPLFVGGYSFGAEVSPFVFDQWPAEERRRVAGQVLIAPGETASFEVSPLNWVFRPKETPLRVASEIRKLGIPTLCLSGQQEPAPDTACDDLGDAVEHVKLPGSHHFNGKYDDVGKVVLDFIDKRMSARVPGHH
jgi:type IV secretory pathway VirJ component